MLSTAFWPVCQLRLTGSVYCTVKGTNQWLRVLSHQLHHLVFKKLRKLRCNTETTPDCFLFTSYSLGWSVSQDVLCLYICYILFQGCNPRLIKLIQAQYLQVLQADSLQCSQKGQRQCCHLKFSGCLTPPGLACDITIRILIKCQYHPHISVLPSQTRNYTNHSLKFS